MTNSRIMALQAPGGVTTSSLLHRVTDPISVLPSASDRMRHFFEGVYDLAPDSHLSRFVKVLLGDSGAGYMQKVYLYARTQSVLATMRYADLDAFYGDVLGLKRMSWERTDPARYLIANTPDEWDEIDARDGAYRARIEAFSRAVAMGGTPTGLKGIAESLLGIECRLYETYLMIDEDGYDFGPDIPVGSRTYERVETEFPRYSDMEKSTYADIEGGYGTIGRSDVNDRAHFTIRPMRSLSSEERYRLTRVLERFKPVGSLLSVDPQGVALHSPAKINRASADSTHWEVISAITPKPGFENLYDPVNHSVNQPRRGYREGDNANDRTFDLTRPALAGKQGDVWNYNADIVRVKGYREIPEAFWPNLPDPNDHSQRVTPPAGWRGSAIGPIPYGSDTGLESNYQRIAYPSGTRDYRPEKGLADPVKILSGRAASDGALVASPVITGATMAEQYQTAGG